jgi:virulence-associated protein VapD
MFAISFDMLVSELKTHYGEPYNNAYYEISNLLEQYGFYRTQGSVYLSTQNDLVNVTRAMLELKKLVWFQKSVRDIRAFKVENWSDFTSFMIE